MIIESEGLKKRVLHAIQLILPAYSHGPLGEQLDSLHRIFIIEQLESELQVNLRAVLFNRNAWIDLESLVDALKK